MAGLADAVRAHGVPVFGPEADAARLEGSKAWAKEVMVRGGIPTARAEVFDRVEPAIGFVDRLGGVAVIKADGLAAGKGVTVARDRDAAIAALRDCLEGHAFGDAGAVVVVEELIEGPEVSAFALVAHGAVVPLSLSQDFKRIGDGDTGPNTGGMGAYSPLPFVDERMEREIWTIVARTVATLSSMGVDYSGLLYTGLMLTDDGPKVLEYNCRFGDPETEAVIPRLAQRPGGAPAGDRHRASSPTWRSHCPARPPSPWCSRRRGTRARSNGTSRSTVRTTPLRWAAMPTCSMRPPRERPAVS